MTHPTDDHVLAVEEGTVSPVIIVMTIIMILIFLIAVIYRLGITVL